MYDLLIENARLYPMAGDAGRATATTLAVRDGLIAAIGTTGAAHSFVDAAGAVVLPGFIDCHTHAVFAGERSAEHRQRLEGATYSEIAKAGGGIQSTVNAVRAASEEELHAASLPRIQALAREGVTCIEIKSGYGLETAAECRMLRAAKSAADAAGIGLVRTFLGAHTVPAGKERAKYMDEVIDEMLPRIEREGLADCVDIYVEDIAFDCADMERLFAAARAAGLPFRAHTDQFSNIGATRAAAAAGALSCDHLEFSEEADAAALGRHDCVAVLLPGAFYFLRETRLPPIAALRQHGVAMAVATDLNPGSSPVASLLTAMHMACTLFGLTPTEALLGVTQHAAAATGTAATRGSLEVGKRADFCLWNIPSPESLLYQLGGWQPSAIYIGGKRHEP